MKSFPLAMGLFPAQKMFTPDVSGIPSRTRLWLGKAVQASSPGFQPNSPPLKLVSSSPAHHRMREW